MDERSVDALKCLDFLNYTYDLELHAIVDGARIGRKKLKDEAEYTYNRNFMGQLGLKSDSVGWIKEYNIEDDRFAKILEKAKEEKVKIRTICDIKVHDQESIEWYILQDIPFVELIEKKIPGTEKFIDTIMGYKLRNHIYDTIGPCVISQKMKAIFEEIGVTGYHAKWIVDNGRYASKSYYALYLDEAIDGYFGGLIGEHMIKKSKEDILAFLKPFSKVASTIIENYPKRTDVDMLYVPMIVNRSLLEGKDIIMVDNHYLVSRKLKEALVKHRLISARAFEPILLCEDDEKFIVFHDSSEFPKLHKAIRKKNEFIVDSEVENYREKQYTLYINQHRPRYEMTEKMALQLLRKEKRDSSQFFSKGVKKEELLRQAINPLQSVYKISNGFYIGGEYQIFSIEERIHLQKEFDSDYQKEQLTNIADDAKVIGKTADGDWLILLKDGRFARYSMGEVAFEETWKSIWMFFEVCYG